MQSKGNKEKGFVGFTREALGFKTLILLSKASCNRHQAKLKEIVSNNCHNQMALIANLNPVISRWSNLFSLSDGITCSVFSSWRGLPTPKTGSPIVCQALEMGQASSRKCSARLHQMLAHGKWESSLFMSLRRIATKPFGPLEPRSGSLY